LNFSAHFLFSKTADFGFELVGEGGHWIQTIKSGNLCAILGTGQLFHRQPHST
jgi:hypothetical protein